MSRPALSWLLLPAFVLAFASAASAHGRSRTALGTQSYEEGWDSAHEGLCDAGVAGCQGEVEHGVASTSGASDRSIAGLRLHHHHWWRAYASRRSGVPAQLSQGLSGRLLVWLTPTPVSLVPPLDLSPWFYPPRL